MLILLNGPPGSGKSTLAQRYVDDRPLALNLDVDRVRALLGRWPDHAYEAGLAARALTLVMARTHLDAGHDVVIPQYLGRVAFIEQIEQLAGKTGVPFQELVPLDSLPNLLRRFAERTRAARPEHVEADAQLRGGGEAALAEMYDRLIQIIDQRPNARIIHSADGKPHETYRRLLEVLEHH
ncbi:MAG TPA: AAA family ATPase [Jatrophihabitantaceae bacterium]